MLMVLPALMPWLPNVSELLLRRQATSVHAAVPQARCGPCQAPCDAQLLPGVQEANLAAVNALLLLQLSLQLCHLHATRAVGMLALLLSPRPPRQRADAGQPCSPWSWTPRQRKPYVQSRSVSRSAGVLQRLGLHARAARQTYSDLDRHAVRGSHGDCVKKGGEAEYGQPEADDALIVPSAVNNGGFVHAACLSVTGRGNTDEKRSSTAGFEPASAKHN